MSPVFSEIWLHTPNRPDASTKSLFAAAATAARKLPFPASLQFVTRTVAKAAGDPIPRIAATQPANRFLRRCSAAFRSISACVPSIARTIAALSISLQRTRPFSHYAIFPRADYPPSPGGKWLVAGRFERRTHSIRAGHPSRLLLNTMSSCCTSYAPMSGKVPLTRANGLCRWSLA